MSKWRCFCRRALMIGVACGLGLLAFEGREASAGIVIELSTDGGATFTDLAPFTTPLATDPGQLNSYGTVDLTALNTFLTGSAYQFTALGGSSNWAGSPSGGGLSLTGGIQILAGTSGSTSLILRETESGFTSPSGPSGTLVSTSQGNYSEAGPPNTHSAQSSFNAVTTALYSVPSTAGGADHEQNSAMAAIPAFVTPYALNNLISFSLVPSTTTVADNFSVVASVTTIPEPASVVSLSIGLPLALVGLVRLAGRRKEKA